MESVAQLLRSANAADLDEKIALVFANSAGKVVYYATILHAHKLKVAALLDSDAAGDQAAQQDTLVNTLGNKKILRTRDAYLGTVTKPEIEDLLRETLVRIALDDLGWDVQATAAKQAERPIVHIFQAEVADFSKYKLAKAFLRWARSHEASDLTRRVALPRSRQATPVEQARQGGGGGGHSGFWPPLYSTANCFLPECSPKNSGTGVYVKKTLQALMTSYFMPRSGLVQPRRNAISGRR